MVLLAQSTVTHAALNHNEPELALEICLQDVRMAMQDCGALLPEKVLEDQEFDGVEDMRGVEGFLDWAMGEGNKEIRRIALEGVEGGVKDDYLTGKCFITELRFLRSALIILKRSRRSIAQQMTKT
jgi:transcription initiation factor TFIID subunit 3